MPFPYTTTPIAEETEENGDCPNVANDDTFRDPMAGKPTPTADEEATPDRWACNQSIIVM